jgi:hypothetical protein
MLSGEKFKDFVARFRKVVAEIRAVDAEQVPTKLAQIIKLKDAMRFASESFYNALMVNDQLPLEVLIRKIEQFSGPNNIAKMKSDELSRTEVVNFVQQKQRETVERNNKKNYSKDSPSSGKRYPLGPSNGLLALCPEIGISENEMKKRYSNKVCLACGSSDHFLNDCEMNPRRKSTSKPRRVIKNTNSRNNSEYDSEESNESSHSSTPVRKSTFFKNTSKHHRVSMIRVSRPDSVTIDHEWYGLDTQAGVKVMTPDVSITRDQRSPGITENKLQSFDSRHEATIDWIGRIGMCDEVQVVIGARNGVIGTEWLGKVLKLKIEIIDGQPVKIIDRNNRVLIYATQIDGMPFIHVSQVMDLCCRGGLTITDHLSELKAHGLTQTGHADCTTAKMMRDLWMERELILCDSDEELFELFTRNGITERQECWIPSETLRNIHEDGEERTAKTNFRIPSEFVRRTIARRDRFTDQRTMVITVNDGILSEARDIFSGNGRTREHETLNVLYDRHAKLLLEDQDLIFEEFAEKKLTIGPEFSRVMPNRRFKLVDYEKILQRGNLQSNSARMEYLDDYGPRSNLDPHHFARDLDEHGSYEDVLMRLHNYLVFKHADRRISELGLSDTNELKADVVRDIHEEVMNSVMWTENNAIAFLEFEDRVADQFNMNLAQLKLEHPLKLLKLNKDRIIRIEMQAQDMLHRKLACEPVSEDEAELSRELLELVLSTQMKNLQVCNGGSQELLDDHREVRKKMAEVVSLHAARRAMLERIMDLQDEIGAKIEMTGEEFDQLAEIQKRVHSRMV